MADPSQRILVFDTASALDPRVVEALATVSPLEHASTVEQAAAALRAGRCRSVLADVGDFLPLERGLAASQASLVLDTIGEGVAIVDAQRGTVWANRRLLAFPDAVREQVQALCAEAQTLFASHAGPTPDASQSRSKRSTFSVDDRHFELVCSPVVSVDGVGHAGEQVVGVVLDVTNSRRLQSKIDAIDSAGSELARIEDEAVAQRKPADRLRILQDKIIGFSKDLLHFDHFAIRLLEKRSRKLEVVIAEGLQADALSIELLAEAEGQGISGYVAATGRSYICYDTTHDPRYVTGLDNARSSLTVPLMLFDRVVGIYNIESNQVGAFDEDDRQFAEIFGRYVAMALHILDLLVIQRYTTSETVTDTVLAEVARPLNDLEAEIRDLKAAHPDDPSLTAKLDELMGNVAGIRRGVKECAGGPQTIVGVHGYEIEAGDPILEGKHILVADDEAKIRQSIAEILRGYGCSVVVCKDGGAACDKLIDQDFDLVLSDIRMPDKTGYEVYSAAHRRNEDTPVILMTGFGYDPHHSIVRAHQEGLAAVLFKPFKIDDLMREVRSALGAPAGEPAPDRPTG